MTKLKKVFPYLFVCAIAFYILPLLPRDKSAIVLMVIMHIPLTCFITSIIYGVKNGVNIVLPLGVGLLFIPAIYIHYNSSAWVYVFLYAIISLVGNLIGRAFQK